MYKDNGNCGHIIIVAWSNSRNQQYAIYLNIPNDAAVNNEPDVTTRYIIWSKLELDHQLEQGT